MKRLNYKAIEFPEMKDRIKMHAKKGNWQGMLSCAGNSMLGFFYDNRAWFEKRGLYEAALLYAWNNQKVTIHWRDHIRLLLLMANREALLEASDPLPEGDVFTIYRGLTDYDGEIHGIPIRGKERGVSWTLNPETAKRFSWEMGKVYATEVRREDIYAYLGHPESCGATEYRREEEVMVLLHPDHPIRVHAAIGKKEEAAHV